MSKYDRWTTGLLTLLVAALLTLCVMSIVAQKRAEAKKAKTEYAGNKE